MNKKLIIQCVNEGLINVKKHPTEYLYIYNYSQEVQYERLWNEATVIARGLILDSEMNVVARPFGKFFNIEEHEEHEIPNSTFDVFEKMDGSLGILYWIGDKPMIATRGSFESEQAIHATKLLYDEYSSTFEHLEKGVTYLFEIIYPTNRIVVDYGGLDDIILLAVIDNKTGLDLELPNIGFKVVKHYDGINNVNVLKSLEKENKEGFVVRFNNGFRLKVKFEEYVRLHRIITSVSNKNIWEYLKTGQSFNEILEKVPDEFYDWVENVRNELCAEFGEIELQAFTDMKNKPEGDAKTFALWAKDQKYTHVLFAMNTGKNYEQIIWKMIKPEFRKPFKIEA